MILRSHAPAEQDPLGTDWRGRRQPKERVVTMKVTAEGIKELVKNYWESLTAVLLGLSTLILALTRIEWIAGRIEVWLKRAEPAEIAGLAARYLAIETLLLAVFFLLSLLFAWRRFSARHDASRYRALDLAHKRSVEESFKIVKQLYPASEIPVFVLRRARYTVTLDKNGDFWVQKEEEISAAHDQELHFRTAIIYVEDEAPGVATLEDIEFQVEDLGKTKVAYLLIQNNDRKKEIATFHLPRLKPEEKEPRKIRTRYSWRGGMKRLVEKREEIWAWRMRSRGAIDVFEFKFFYHPDLGSILCTHEEPLLEPKPELRAVTSDSNWPGWSFRAKDAPGEVVYSFRFKRARENPES